MYYNSQDPYYDDGSGGFSGGYSGGSSGGVDSGITDPSPTKPTYKPTPNGWWELIGGVWHWMTEPARTLKVN
jgi:hypothetical protein